MVDPELPADLTAEVRLQWWGAEGLPLQVANQFVVQMGLPAENRGPDGVFLLVGEASPPVILNPEDLAGQTGVLPVRAHARYHLSRARLGELRDLINRVTDQYDAIHAQVKMQDDGQEDSDASDLA